MKNTNAMERPRKPRVGMISLGCAKNLVDAEIMLGNVLQRGMEITSRADDTPSFRLSPAHFAYVKIAEGCNDPCSFCVIPQMRGKHRSRKPDSVLAEIRALVCEGVREINLISQDTTYYGMDLWQTKAGPRQPVD